MNIDEQEILRMALVGYAMELVKVEDQIDSVKIRLAISELGQTHVPGRFGPHPVNPPTQKMLNRKPGRHRRRKLSPEGRARIIAATKKRWARYRAKREKARKGGRA